MFARQGRTERSLQSTNNIPCNHRLNTSDDDIHDGHDPDDFPVLVLNHARIARGAHVDADDTDEGPVEREEPHGVSIVQIGGLRAADGEGPI